MNILVTGSSGFLAGALIRLLRRHSPARVISTDLRAASGSITCDLRDPQAALRLIRRYRPDAVFHLAGTTRPGSWQDLWDAHVAATINLFEALARCPRPERIRVVVAGSSAEYGASRGLPVSETAVPEPVSLYGASKLSQTLAALSFRDQIPKVAVARIFNVLGPGMPDNLALGSFAKQIAEAEAAGRSARIRVGNLRPRRDYLDVRDVAAALYALLRQPRSGIFNVCSGRSLAMRELLSLLADHSRQHVSTAPDPARMRKVDVPNLYGDPRRLQKVSAWRPRITLRQSLADTLDWHRSIRRRA